MNKAKLEEALGNCIDQLNDLLYEIEHPAEEERTKYWGLYDTADSTWMCMDADSWNVRPRRRFRYTSEQAAETELQSGHYVMSIVSKPFYVKK